MTSGTPLQTVGSLIAVVHPKHTKIEIAAKLPRECSSASHLLHPQPDVARLLPKRKVCKDAEEGDSGERQRHHRRAVQETLQGSSRRFAEQGHQGEPCVQVESRHEQAADAVGRDAEGQEVTLLTRPPKA